MKNQKIGIIGAGIAGASTAEALREKGYSDIIIFEKNQHAGGKCSSIKYNGRSYEMGAVLLVDLKENPAAYALAKKKGSKLFPLTTTRMCCDEKGNVTLLMPPSDKLKILRQLIRYRLMTLTKMKPIHRPGYAAIPKFLYQPFDKWADENNLSILKRLFKIIYTPLGYGYTNLVSAAYVIKFLCWSLIKTASSNSKRFIFNEGMQSFVQSIADDHKVVYNAGIKSIKRGKKITITTGSEVYEFDKLIIASPLDECITYMDCSDLEKMLFARIKNLDYRIYLCRIDNISKEILYIPPNVNQEASNKPIFLFAPYNDTDVYQCYVLCDDGVEDSIVEKNLKNWIEKNMGGVFKELIAKKRWKYFPHVSEKDFEEGFYEKLEGLQGANNTYYVGEIMNFPMVANVATYSVFLVNKFF